MAQLCPVVLQAAVPQASDMAPLTQGGVVITPFLLCRPGAGCLSPPSFATAWAFSSPALPGQQPFFPSCVFFPTLPHPSPFPWSTLLQLCLFLSLPLCSVCSSLPAGEEARCCSPASTLIPESHSRPCLWAGDLGASEWLGSSGLLSR